MTITPIKDQIIEEINIEIDDKITLIDDGIPVSDIINDDFTILKKYMYRLVERNKKHLTVQQIRLLLDYIDREIKNAVDYVIKYLYKKGGKI